MVTETTKDRVGEILFKMMTAAMNEQNIPMSFPSWREADRFTKGNYLNFADDIIDVFGTGESVQVSTTEIDGNGGTPYAIPSEESNLLDQIMAESPVSVTVTEIPLEEAVDSLACDVCGKVTKSKQGLKIHKSLHD